MNTSKEKEYSNRKLINKIKFKIKKYFRLNNKNNK